MAGGAIFNHLDYSFTTDNEDGSFVVEKGQPGGGSKALRSQLKILAEFMKSIDYINMKPVDESQLRLTGEGNKSIRALGKDGFIAAYVCRKDTASGPIGIEIDLRSGSYKITLAETTAPSENVAHIRNHPGGWLKIASDGYFEDLAIKIEREK